MGRRKDNLSKADLKLIELVAQGQTATESARELGMDEAHARRIMRRDDVKDLMAGYVTDAMRQAAGRAASVLKKQLESDNPWVAQQAARTILQYCQAVDSKASSMVVMFESMPTPALPSQAEETVKGVGSVS